MSEPTDRDRDTARAWLRMIGDSYMRPTEQQQSLAQLIADERAFVIKVIRKRIYAEAGIQSHNQTASLSIANIAVWLGTEGAIEREWGGK